MGTRLERRRKTRAEKIAESKGKTPERLRRYLNNMTALMRKECDEIRRGRHKDLLQGQGRERS